MQRLLLGAVVGALGLSSSTAFACSSCGCTLSSDWDSQGFATQSGFRVDLRYDYIDQSQLRSGTDAVDRADIPLPQDREIEQQTINRYTTLGLDYSPDADWGINLQLPHTNRSHTTYPEGETTLSSSHSSSIADVRVVSLVHDRDEAAQANTLRQLGVGVTTAMVPRARNLVAAALALPTDTPLTHALLHAPAMRAAIARATTRWFPDVVLAYCTGVAPLALAPPLDEVPLVLDVVDVDSAKWAAFAEATRFPRAWIYRREARCLGAFEQRAVRSAFAATVVNERERDTLLRGCRGADVHVIPNGVDVSALTPHEDPAHEERVIFTAVFDYAPNTEGALWFARRVWPLVRARRSGGATMSPTTTTWSRPRRLAS